MNLHELVLEIDMQRSQNFLYFSLTIFFKELGFCHYLYSFSFLFFKQSVTCEILNLSIEFFADSIILSRRSLYCNWI